MILFARIFIALSFLLLAFSCSKPNFNQTNDDFNKKYSQQIERIKIARTPAQKDDPKQITFSIAPTPEQVAIDTANDYYPYANIAKFGEKLPQNYLPNAEFYDQAKSKAADTSMSPNIFDLTYNTALYPPFRRIGAEFDMIRIPQHDAYGVKTAMSDKTYLLPGSLAVQRAIDLIENEKTSQDNEISAILVAEKKQIARKRKALKMLGEEDSVELVALDEDEVGEKSDRESVATKPNPEKIQQASNNANSGFSIKTVKN